MPYEMGDPTNSEQLVISPNSLLKPLGEAIIHILRPLHRRLPYTVQFSGPFPFTGLMEPYLPLLMPHDLNVEITAKLPAVLLAFANWSGIPCWHQGMAVFLVAVQSL